MRVPRERRQWPEAQRTELAALLLRRYDQPKTAHCTLSFDTLDELAAHKKECAFRPFSCTHKGCFDTFSAHLFIAHDAKCTFKLVDCPLACNLTVPRADMQQHLQLECMHRDVQCPYSELGCVSAVRIRV